MNAHPYPTAVITGGTSGIGLAAAQLLHKEGWQVLVTGQNPDTLAAAEQTLPEEVLVVRADSRLVKDSERLALEIENRFGRLGLLYLNAGTGGMRPIEAVDENFFDDVVDTNFRGQYFTLQKLLPLMAEGSTVVFNSAPSAQLGTPNYSVYSATKGAVETLTRALAAELGPRQIRVNCVTPGPTETPAFEAVATTVVGLSAEAFRAVVRSKVPLARLGDTDEIARAISYLASPAASYVNGTILTVDGGMGRTF